MTSAPATESRANAYTHTSDEPTMSAHKHALSPVEILAKGRASKFILATTLARQSFECSNQSTVKHNDRRPVMILPQVHLRKPCYDFYFL